MFVSVTYLMLSRYVLFRVYPYVRVAGRAQLAEIAHRLDIGYTIYDMEGRKYQKPT